MFEYKYIKQKINRPSSFYMDNPEDLSFDVNDSLRSGIPNKTKVNEDQSKLQMSFQNDNEVWS